MLSIMHDVGKEIIQHGFKVFTIKYRPNTTMSIFLGFLISCAIAFIAVLTHSAQVVAFLTLLPVETVY